VITVNRTRLEARLEALARFGALPGGGVTRPCWSPAHEQARAWLLGEMRAAGLATWVDPAGNTFGALGTERLDPARPLVLTGSHIDTVPEGGVLDGALGVIAGLECLERIRESGRSPRRPLAVAAWSDEEGRYASLFGSRAFTGALDVARLPTMAAADGERLVDAMARAGFDALRAPEAQAPPGSVAAYVELHIEQGPRLEEAGRQIGVVEAIVGVRRYRVTVRGQADHAGTTPMDRRRDAFLAAADYGLRCRARLESAGGPHSVMNIGVVRVHPGVSNIVPGRAELIHEMRDPDPRILERLGTAFAAVAAAIAGERGVGMDLELLSASQPASASPEVQAVIEQACRALGLTWQRLHSAAGHDAQNLARIAPMGMIFIPSKGGRSHRVDEASDGDAIERGANVLLHTLLALADAPDRAG
jgi:N-carbamoyl-L-amino-acid hydrolase